MATTLTTTSQPNNFASAMKLVDETAPVNFGELKDMIMTPDGYTPKFQDASAIGAITQEYMKNLQPMYDAAANRINQQAATDRNAAADFMANKGLSRSGANVNQLNSINQNRNNALGEVHANLTGQAVNNAVNMANLGLSEQNMMQNQRKNAVSQLSSLLNLWQQGRAQDQSMAMDEAGLTGQYNGQSTLAAQQLANQMAQQGWQNQFSQSQLDWQKQNAINQLAAELMNSYMNITNKATLPNPITKLLNDLFSAANQPAG